MDILASKDPLNQSRIEQQAALSEANENGNHNDTNHCTLRKAARTQRVSCMYTDSAWQAGTDCTWDLKK